MELSPPSADRGKLGHAVYGFFQFALDPGLPARLTLFVYRFRRALAVLILGLYLLGFNGQWRVEPDAALYLSLGRNLAEGHGYTHLGKPHHLAYPGLPWIIAGTFRAFPTPHLWPAHVLMLGFTLATLALVYRLFVLHTDRPTAVLVTFGVAITKTFYRYAYELRPDMPFLFGVMAFLCGYESLFAHPQPGRTRRWVDWILLGGGLVVATVMRPTIWVLVTAIVVAAVGSALRGQLRWKTLLPFLIGLAVLILAFRHFDPRFSSPSGSDDYEAFAVQSLTRLGDTLHTVVHDHLYTLLAVATPDALMQVRLGYPNVLLSLFFIGLGVGLVRQHLLWGVLVALIVVMNALVPPLDRYYLPVIPLMVYAWWLGARWVLTRWPYKITAVLALIVVGTGVGSNITKIGGIITEQRHRPFLTHYQNGKFVPLVRLATKIKAQIDPRGMVLVQHADGRILSYLSHRYVADRRDFSDLNLSAQPLYVVEPTDASLDIFLAANHLAAGPVMATVHNDPRPPYTLNQVVPAK